MSINIVGGCMCGAVRYSGTAAPLFLGNCHCRDCQRASGGPYAPAVVVPRASVTITGPVKYFAVIGDSGQKVSRGFCAQCGSRLLAMPDFAPHLTSIMAGSLDDPGGFAPTVDIYCASAQPWDHMDPALPKFERAPRF